jgi:hypothetical protein
MQITSGVLLWHVMHTGFQLEFESDSNLDSSSTDSGSDGCVKCDTCAGNTDDTGNSGSTDSIGGTSVI